MVQMVQPQIRTCQIDKDLCLDCIKDLPTYNFDLLGYELQVFSWTLQLMLNTLQDHFSHAADLNKPNN